MIKNYHYISTYKIIFIYKNYNIAHILLISLGAKKVTDFSACYSFYVNENYSPRKQYYMI